LTMIHILAALASFVLLLNGLLFWRFSTGF
jgi:hypothetical protein